MSETKLLAACMDSRDAWSQVAPFVDEKDFSPPGQFWWKLIEEWYGTDRSSQSIDRSAIADRGTARSTGKQRDAVLGFLRDLADSSTISATNIAQTALELKRYNVGMELAAAIAAGDEKKQAKLVPLFAELRAATDLRGKKAVQYEIAPAAREVLESVTDANRVPLAPSRLNTRIDGGALPGTHVLLFARPEMGKSTFAINFAVQAAKKGKRVGYFSNEDALRKLKTRAIARGTGMTTREVVLEPEKAVELYTERGLDELLTFIKLTNGSVEALRKPIEEYELEIIVMDQIRNLGGAEDRVQRMDENGQRFRELLLEYDLIGLSIAQASAYAGTWLGMEDLDSSKTGLPGSADLMIGMGADEDMLARGQRALSLCKNKMSAEVNSKEGLLVEMDLARVLVK